MLESIDGGRIVLEAERAVAGHIVGHDVGWIRCGNLPEQLDGRWTIVSLKGCDSLSYQFAWVFASSLQRRFRCVLKHDHERAVFFTSESANHQNDNENWAHEPSSKRGDS